MLLTVIHSVNVFVERSIADVPKNREVKHHNCGKTMIMNFEIILVQIEMTISANARPSRD